MSFVKIIQSSYASKFFSFCWLFLGHHHVIGRIQLYRKFHKKWWFKLVGQSNFYDFYFRHVSCAYELDSWYGGFRHRRTAKNVRSQEGDQWMLHCWNYWADCYIDVQIYTLLRQVSLMNTVKISSYGCFWYNFKYSYPHIIFIMISIFLGLA